uniref:Integrator complex subunit 3 N-terminal domain-containing protein n=1 Tax=Lactuca sativa TaxID=4236 RepID=A0A9R1XFR5_LACSA|nr:hypothetical protein LSAT_V11C500289540 [Lactuca sativa]
MSAHVDVPEFQEIWKDILLFPGNFKTLGESVVIDIVRFIGCAHHPSNKTILSKVIPRWAVIGWLLTCCSKNHVQANVMLAFLYAFLFVHEEVDNVMNIEPIIFLMINSMPKYVDMTQNLLEFLFLLVDHYDVERKILILRGVLSILDVLERKGKLLSSKNAGIVCKKVILPTTVELTDIAPYRASCELGLGPQPSAHVFVLVHFFRLGLKKLIQSEVFS